MEVQQGHGQLEDAQSLVEGDSGNCNLGGLEP